MTKLSTHWLAMWSLPTLLATVSTPAFADDTELEMVTVTAQYKVEDAQKTAVSMEVLSSEKLAEAGITSVAEIAKFTPGLQLEQPGGGLTATVRIRGVGTPGFSALDPSVPIFIDGVAQARTGAGFQDLLDVERVEVLRGPQGTLYGRNSTAGAINVWTKKANTHDFEASAEIQAGNYDNRSGKLSVNVPLIDDLLAARLSGFKVKQDGYLTNGYTGQTGNGDADRSGARGKIGITPTDKLDIQIIGDYSESTTHPLDSLHVVPHVYNQYASSPATPAGGGASEACGDPTGASGQCDDDFYVAPHPAGIASKPNLIGIPLNANGMPIDDRYNGRVYRDFDAETFDRSVATSMTIKWDFSDALNVTSISAWNRYTTDQTLDLDHSILDFYLTRGHTKTVSKSQELRLAGSSDHVDYVVGGYYADDVVDSDNVTDGYRTDKISASDKFTYFLNQGTTGVIDTPGATAYAHSITNMDTKFKALFGQLTYKIGDFNFTGGLRRSFVTKYADTAVYLIGFNTFTGQPAPCSVTTQCELIPRLLDHVTTDYANTSGVFKVRYFVTDDWMVYASYDKGYKPGGYNRKVSVAATVPPKYNEEKSTNYEIGLKGSLNRRLQVGLSVFHMDFKGFQNQTQTTDGDLLIENLAKVTSEGVELDVQALLTDGLTFGVGYAYLDPRVKENDPTRPANCQQVSGNPNYYCNGQRLFDVSQHTVNANLNYERTITDAGAQGFARIDWSWRSEYGVSEARYGYVQDPVALTNLRLGVRKLADHWTVTAWTKNVFNKEYAATGGALMGGLPVAKTDGHFIVQGAPRTFGLTVQGDF